MIELFYVKVSDYEASWYDSVWENEYMAKKAFDGYALVYPEQMKQLGKRKMNSREQGTIIETEIVDRD